MEPVSGKNNISRIIFLVFVALMLSFNAPSAARADIDGCSETANGHNCDEWDFSNWPNSVSQETCRDNNDTLGDYIYTLGIHYRTDVIRGNVTLPAGWGDKCAIQCTDSADCGGCECRCQGDGLYCADRMSDSSGRIVSQSCKVTDGSPKCTPTARITSYSVTNGSCGTRSDNYSATAVPPYAYNTTAWPSGSAYCSSGTSSASPTFPPQGGSVSWNCSGGNVSFNGAGGDPTGNNIVEYQWIIRTHANNAAKNYSQDITISGPTASSFSRNLTPNSYYVFFRVKPTTLVWSSWVYVSMTVRTPASCSASRGILQGACGTNAKSYVSTTTVWPSTVATAWCSAGTLAGSAPAFPAAPGTNVSWKCNGSDPTKTTDDKTCYAYRLSDYGCGTRQDFQPYAASATGWPVGSTSCSSGNPDPINPVFPQLPGGTVTWTCPSGPSIIGVAGSVPCFAHRNSYVCQGTVPENATACGPEQVTHDLNWRHVDSCSLGECEFVCNEGYFWNDSNNTCQQDLAVFGCGTASNKVYSFDAEEYGEAETFCGDNMAPDPRPVFPDPGEIVSWNCDNGQTDCSATRQRDLNWKEVAPSN